MKKDVRQHLAYVSEMSNKDILIKDLRSSVIFAALLAIVSFASGVRNPLSIAINFVVYFIFFLVFNLIMSYFNRRNARRILNKENLTKKSK